MIRFVFKFFCVFYIVIVTVNTRSLYNTDKCSKFRDIFGFENINDTQPKNNGKREAKSTEVDKILANVTEKINNLKEEYGVDKYKLFLPKLNKIIYEYNTVKTTTERSTVENTEVTDFLGTAQIEELLNEIKARAIEMVAEQNPSVTDMITNTVTEATFEADPILTHLEISSPGYAVTTFVCLNNIENIDKRTANDSSIILISNKETKHNISARSVKEDAYTIAQNVEDMLQKELKSIYKKVKNKVSKDFNKEVAKAKSTIKCESSKVIDKVEKKVTGAMKTSHLTTHRKQTTKSRHNRGNKTTKKMRKSTKHQEETTATPTVDDFAMLTLYEQILAKSHEDNVMKMLTTNKKRKYDEIVRLSKRNPETLADITLKEDVKRMYDVGESIPDIDYNKDVVIPEIDNDYSAESKTNSTTVNSEPTHTSEVTPVEDTSYEGLSEKIAYKDYVNGYKNYLNFQRDQAKENFSALVKYQAHRHHNIDDIGKYILEKIPRVPSRKRRHFFDDSDIDELDISTRSDDSWFKKHFYMFIDSGPPKKYHTSETVEFKVVTEANRVGYTNSIEKPGLRITLGPDVDRTSEGKEQTADINLDELSKGLEDYKATAAGVPLLNNDNIIDTTQELVQNNDKEYGRKNKVYAPSIMSKFFGKGRRNPARASQKDDNTLNFDDKHLLTDSDLERFRRNAKKSVTIDTKEVDKKLTLTKLNKQAKNDKTNTNNEKVGCVSIVTQPTSIVNLHNTNAKGSKIKNLLNKLHFRKKNKKKIKKRHCTRVQRFNPLKKLKDMFLPRPGEDNMAPKSNEDYDMITSHIDTFKPVKYDKIPSIDELRNQVPNISGDIITSQPVRTAVADPPNEFSVKDDTNMMNKVVADIDTNVPTKGYTVSPNSRIFQPTTKAQPKNLYKTQMISNNQMPKDNYAVADDVMNVKVKTLPKMEDIFTVSPVTLEDIRNEINKIQMKLTTDDALENSEDKTSPKLIIQQRTYDKLNNADDNELNDDITIKAKLTKIAKYPISKLKTNFITEMNPVGDNPKLYEFIDDDSYLNVHEESYPSPVSEKRTPFFEIQYTTKDKGKVVTSVPLIDITLKNLDNVKEVPIDSLNNYKTYPDYFHDLVMWNSDILNYDKVSNPTWQDILRNIQSGQEFTTPNVRDMEKELYEINEHLINNDISQINNKDVTPRTVTKFNSHVLSSPRYIAKADNIKVAVENNKMGNYPFFEDLNEDSNNAQKKYSTVKSQDIIDVLNKLYTEHPYEVKTRANTLRSINNKAKNSLKSRNYKNKETRPIAKVIKQPQQYYNTPLPMKNEQFEKFLRENQLDVESVTVPMNEMPTVTETWHSRINPLTKTINFDDNMNIKTTPKKTFKVTDDIQETTKVGYKNRIDKVIDKSYPENQIEYLNDLEQDLFNDYRDNGNIRHKRYSVHDYDTFTDNALIGSQKIEKIKNQLNNMFDKKSEISTDKNLNSISYPNENEVEITLINFDDTDKHKVKNDKVVTNPNDVLIKVNSTVNDDTKILANIDSPKPIKKQKVSSETEKDKLLHNRNLQLKDDEGEKYFNLDAQVNSKGLERKESSFKMKDGITSMNLMQSPNKLSEKCKDKEGNLPKRVQISSHSYKYDVLYNVPLKTAKTDTKMLEDKVVGDKEGDIEVKTPAYDSNLKRFSDFYDKESTNSEIHQLVVIVDVVKAVDDYTRPDIPIHINLPTYYAPNTKTDNTELLPVSLKTSWTDLVLKYISGIALIEMLNKLGVLKGGLNLTDGLNVNFDRDKSFSDKRVMDNDGKLRAERAAKTTKKRHTFSQTLHFTREMDRPRNKRLFNLLPLIKNKLKIFANNKNTTSAMTTKKKIPTKSLKIIATTRSTDETVATNEEEYTTRNERDSESNDNSSDIFDYKGDIDVKKDVNIKQSGDPTMNPLFILTHTEKFKRKNKIKPMVNNSDVYIEDTEYDDQVYYEIGAKANKAAKKTKTTTSEIDSNKIDTDSNAYNKLKRDVSHETYTAKDVAALEVIVDLMKNTMNYAEKSPYEMFSRNNFIAAQRTKPRKITNEKMEHVTNSIQVHIAIPYDVSDKRRSLDPLKVRKVFTAKMATPVDLEYQIHSVEDNIATTAVNLDQDYGLSPGMYLLVDDANTFKGSFALKPVKPSSAQMRNVDEVTAKSEDEKDDKVTLSKEFIAAVNKHLIQLYENITAANNDPRNKKHKVTRRETSWDKVKKYFGHDRVCNCKCIENKTMCRACAASDAVIKELTFEFDNLAKYMSDHCTEIQTFFRMNPSGGRILRDSVHKIDKSLNDYYKRVKGKCQGRTCKTFATYIDKRDFDRNKQVARNFVGESLITDLKSLNDKFDKLSSNTIPYDENLRDKGDELVKVARNCITSKPINKRSNFVNKNKQKADKEFYTLDNISVNIICSPEASSESSHTSPVSFIETPISKSENILLDYDSNKRNSKKNKLKNLFARKNKPKLSKLFTYYETQVTEANTFKREAKYNQIESPLISDTGGSFWHDYLSKGNVDVSNDINKPNVKISVVQTNTEQAPVTQASVKSTESFKDKLKNMYKSKDKAIVQTNDMQFVAETQTDSLSYNMNELFKLIGTIKDVEDVKNTFTDPTIVTRRNNTTKHKTKKTKTKKHKKIHKKTKAKMHKHKTKTTDIPTNTYSTSSITNTDKTAKLNVRTTTVPKTETTLNSLTEEITAPFKTYSQTKTLESTTTKKNLFNKIKMATLGFLSNIGKGNYVLDLKTTKASIDRQIRTADDKNNKDDKINGKKHTKTDINVISEATTKINPTILIINEDSTIRDTKERKSNYRSILLSLLNFERGKLDKERERINEGVEKEIDVVGLIDHFTQEDVDDIENTLMNLKMQPKKASKSSQQDIDYDIFRSLKTIGRNLELPAPPGLQTQLGTLEKVAHNFGVKVVPEKVAPIMKSTKNNLWIKEMKRKLAGFKEAEPSKNSNYDVNYNRRSNDRKYIDTDVKTSKTKYGRIEFDCYLRQKHGIYRIKRQNKDEGTTITEETEHSKGSVAPKVVRNPNDKCSRKKRKKHKNNDKRLDTDRKSKNNGRLATWLQYSTGYILIIATGLYIICALFALVINWLFRTHMT